MPKTQGARRETAASLRVSDAQADEEAPVAPRPHEKVRVPPVARDPQRVKHGDAAVDEGHLRLGECAGSRHEIDITHRTPATNRDIKQRRPDASGENATFEGGAVEARRVEYRLVEHRLNGQPGAGEDELFVWIDLGVDAGVDRRPSVDEAEGRPSTHNERGADVSRFVE